MVKHNIIKEQSQTVALANDLIQKSRYELSKTEQKAVLYMASKIKPYDEAGTEYIFNAENFCRVCNFNVEGGWYIQQVKDIVIELKSHILTIPLGGGKKVITSWFNDAVLDEESGEIKISFSKYLTPYLYELQKHYTSFALEFVLPMKSKHGIRLYEYLKSVKYKGMRHLMTLEELRQRVGCEGQYTQSSDIRSRVIEPALKDINTYTDLDVGYRFIKTGRKVSHIEFTIMLSDDAKRLLNRVRDLGMR